MISSHPTFIESVFKTDASHSTNTAESKSVAIYFLLLLYDTHNTLFSVDYYHNKCPCMAIDVSVQYNGGFLLLSLQTTIRFADYDPWT